MPCTKEVEAVTLVAHADPALARAALSVLAKIAAVVTEDLRSIIDDPAVGTPPAHRRGDGHVDMARLRRWCREGRTLSMGYVGGTGATSERIVRPFMVGYVVGVRVIVAWCELQQDFRTFRTDRVTAATFLDQRYPERPATLRRRWLAMMREQHAASLPIDDSAKGRGRCPNA